MFSAIPHESPNLHNQARTTDVNDEFFRLLFEPRKYVIFHYIYQIICFFVFLGPLKLFLALITIVLWELFLHVLNLFRRIFKSSLSFKLWAHSFMRHLLRIFLFFIGIVSIDVDGKFQDTCRFIASNHVSLLDYLIFLYVSPATFIKKAAEPGLEWYFTSPLFDIFYLRPKKRLSASEQLLNCAADPSFFPILIFPEDVPTNGDAVIGFRPAAFFSEYSVQPAALRYRLWFTPRGFNSVCWDGKSFFSFVFHILCLPFVQVEVNFLPISEKKGEMMTPRDKATLCQLQVANRLGTLAATKSVSANKVKRMNSGDM